ncbi:MAGE-domain-containing protein [Auriculariales sp. MPI-PUGE-AT-0066]|nr:MAGE-domain-containing protein [Auriculariales sp. MPI-PUGE-AT-0066]
MPPRANRSTQGASQSQRTYSQRGKRAADSDDEAGDDQMEQDYDEEDDDEEDARKTKRRSSSQKQKATQSQSHRRRDDTPDDDDGDGVDMDGEGGESGHSTEVKAAALVRLALATEFKRSALKRDDIVKKALKGDGKSFKEVFALAQSQLKKIFGYELVEIQTRQERDRILAGKDEDANQKKANPSKQYILRSVIDAELIHAASQVDRTLRDLEIAERNEDETRGVLHDDGEPLPEGTILAHTDRDALGAQSLGLLHVVLALIVVSGRTMNEAHLRNWLKKLRMADKSAIAFPNSATRQTILLNDWFNEMCKLNYLDRTVFNPSVAGAAAQGKRARPKMNADEDSNEIVELRWGERAHIEISEKAVAEWVVAFMLDSETQDGAADEDDEEPANARDKRAREQRRADVKQKREKAMDAMLKDVRRAAGGLEG